MLEIHSYEYKGHTLVVFPNGAVHVHMGTGSTPPDGDLLTESKSLGDAMAWVNETVKNMVE